MSPRASDSPPPALFASALGKRYGARRALKGVDLEVRAGELVGLLGPNGAGKSTLTKIACGLVRPTEGRVSVCGAPAGSPSARAAIGYLAELFRFPGWATADEVLVLHQRLAGSSGGEGERAELLELVDLAQARGVRVERMRAPRTPGDRGRLHRRPSRLASARWLSASGAWRPPSKRIWPMTAPLAIACRHWTRHVWARVGTFSLPWRFRHVSRGQTCSLLTESGNALAARELPACRPLRASLER